MKARLLAFAIILGLLPLPGAFAATSDAAGSFELPLPYRGEEVRKQMNEKLVLVAVPESDGELRIEVVEADGGPDAVNLLYHSDQWHGPYPTHVYAWHVAKRYFPNSRWVCVTGYPIEVHITLKHPKVKTGTEEPVFVSGKVAVAWFNRPCTRGFGRESEPPRETANSYTRKLPRP